MVRSTKVILWCVVAALRSARAELAHINRVTTMGELTASLAHEVNQPIAAAATNAEACLRWLTRDAQRLRCQVGLLIQLFKIL